MILKYGRKYEKKIKGILKEEEEEEMKKLRKEKGKHRLPL